MFWPRSGNPLLGLVGTFGNPNYFAGFPSSDLQLVFSNVRVVPEPGSSALMAGAVTLSGLLLRRRGRK